MAESESASEGRHDWAPKAKNWRPPTLCAHFGLILPVFHSLMCRPVCSRLLNEKKRLVFARSNPLQYESMLRNALIFAVLALLSSCAYYTVNAHYMGNDTYEVFAESSTPT